MSYEQACAVLGPEIVAEIESRPPVPLSPEQIARIAPLLRAVLDTPDEASPAA